MQTVKLLYVTNFYLPGEHSELFPFLKLILF